MTGYTHRKFAAALLSLLLISLSACTSTAQVVSATPIPGLANTLAVQTMTAQPELLYLFATPTPPATVTPQPPQGSDAEENVSVDNKLSSVSEPQPSPTSPYANDIFFSSYQPMLDADGKEVLCNAAAFVRDITIPDDSVLKPKTNFVKTWEIKNTGACTWTPDYQVTLVWGDSLSGQSPSLLGKYVRPGESVEISIPMLTPSVGSCYQSSWMLQDPDGNQFGVGYKAREFFYVAISVWEAGMPRIVH